MKILSLYVSTSCPRVEPHVLHHYRWWIGLWFSPLTAGLCLQLLTGPWIVKVYFGIMILVANTYLRKLYSSFKR